MWRLPDENRIGPPPECSLVILSCWESVEKHVGCAKDLQTKTEHQSHRKAQFSAKPCGMFGESKVFFCSLKSKWSKGRISIGASWLVSEVQFHMPRLPDVLALLEALARSPCRCLRKIVDRQSRWRPRELQFEQMEELQKADHFLGESRAVDLSKPLLTDCLTNLSVVAFFLIDISRVQADERRCRRSSDSQRQTWQSS